MGTVSKAMALLEVFSPEVPELGLSELSRVVKFDKATTLRLLSSLAAHGMVEKTGPRKTYRLGPAVQRLASIRGETLSFAETAQPILDRLSADTGESCHISEASSGQLSTVLLSHCNKPLRVNFSLGEQFPFHCTASGVAYLAFGPAHVFERVLKGPMPRVTSRSKTKPSELKAHVSMAKVRGFAINIEEYEADTVSVAAPIFGQDGLAFAAISMAAPASRADERSLMKHGTQVLRAARDITTAIGGTFPGVKS